jgi:hypothetical protein
MNQRFLLGGAVTVTISVVGILLEAWGMTAPLDMLFGREDFSGGLVGRSLAALGVGAVLLTGGFIAGTRSGFLARG